MTSSSPTPSVSEFVAHVFEEYTNALKESGLPGAVTNRLRKLLLSDKPLTEKAIADALLTEEPLP
jgi:hypothetical protein